MKSTKDMNIFNRIKNNDREEHIPTFQAWGDKLVSSGRLKKFHINLVPTGRH
jgi:hypothetical protein